MGRQRQTHQRTEEQKADGTTGKGWVPGYRWLIIAVAFIASFPWMIPIAKADSYPASVQWAYHFGSWHEWYTSSAEAGQAAFTVWPPPSYVKNPGKLDWFFEGCSSKTFIDRGQGQLNYVYVLLTTTSSVNGFWCENTGIALSYYYYCPHGGKISYFYVGQCVNAPSCPAPQVRDAATGECKSDTYTVTLKPDRPSTEPSTNLSLTVTVEDQGHQPPKNPVPVKISLKVDSTSGGHAHGDSTRPRGDIDDKKCETDDTCKTLSIGSEGSATITFKAPVAAGKHTVTATCDKCSNGPQEAAINVKVKESDAAGWDTVSASPTEYVLIGGEEGKKHHDNHYLTGKARENLLALVDEYNKTFPSGPRLRLNDASLVWGGKFDISGSWGGSHNNHRRGVVIDIRANQDVTAIPQARFSRFEAMAKKSGAYADLHCAFSGKYICPACLLDTGSNRHYHVRLLGQGIDR